jgi:hypothetical protein
MYTRTLQSQPHLLCLLNYADSDISLKGPMTPIIWRLRRICGIEQTLRHINVMTGNSDFYSGVMHPVARVIGRTVNCVYME